MPSAKPRKLLAIASAVLVAGIAAPAAAEGNATDTDVELEGSLTAYLESQDTAWVAPQARSPRMAGSPTEAERINAATRDALDDDGTPIVDAQSSYDVLSSVEREPDILEVHASVTTEFSYGGAGAEWPQGSVWTDEHLITLDTSGARPIVVQDVLVEPPADTTPDDPNAPAPTQSSADRQAALAAASPGGGFTTFSQPTADIYNQQAYAWEWTSPPNDGDTINDFNPAFPWFDNNCANFVSQVFRAGGWQYKGGVNPFDTDNWSPNLTGPGTASRTWSSAKYQYTFFRYNGGLTPIDNIWNARAGEVLYTDWDPNNTPDGSIDHVMFVAYGDGIPGDSPIISQKTPNRNMIPLTQSIANAQAQGKTITWFGLGY